MSGPAHNYPGSFSEVWDNSSIASIISVGSKTEKETDLFFNPSLFLRLPLPTPLDPSPEFRDIENKSVPF